MNSTGRGALVLLMALVTAGCTESSTGPNRAGVDLAGEDQNPPDPLDEGCGDLPVAPDSVRVDLIDPTFSAPTDISNPLFPVGELERAHFNGSIDGESFRSETTRMPGTRTIVVDGQEIELVISQYVAWLDRRIDEVAIDLYAEDDDGNVYYFGEDVFNYEDGVIVDTEGTWLAGVDGPPAMIMPADPQVGNVWRPENACPIVFEEVTALQTGVVVDGPHGPVAGALIVRELHMDGTTEDKTFAPGYGEFSTGSGVDLEAMALAVPVDALPGEAPEELDDLSDAAEEIFQLAQNGRWRRVTNLFEEMVEDWEEYRATGVPPRIAGEMDAAMDALEEAIGARDKAETRQASVDAGFACTDFELQYEDREENDRDLIELWTRQLRIDHQAHDRPGVLSDLESIRVIRERFGDDASGPIDSRLASLRSAALAGDDAGIEQAASRLASAVVAGTSSAGP
jgi:hypothetical protein